MEDQTLQNNNSINQSVNGSVPVSSPVKNNNFPVIILGIFVLILVASTGFLFYQNLQLKNQLINYQAKPVSSPTPTSSLTPSASTDGALLNMSGTLQDLMKSKCKPGNPQFLSSQDLPVNLNKKFIQLTPRPDNIEIYCASMQINTEPILNGYLGLNTVQGTINVYEKLSEEGGHGGYPFLGFVGQKIYEQDGIQIGAFLQGGDGPQVLGDVGLGLRGVKKFVTKDGNTIYANITVRALEGNDSRLISQLKPYSSPMEGLDQPVVNYDQATSTKIVNYFFSTNPGPTTPEGQALQKVKDILTAISAK